MSFNVEKVIDGDTFDVTPNWKWGDKEGDRVRIANLDAPELNQPGGQAAKTRMG